jgi:hypothetical protein
MRRRGWEGATLGDEHGLVDLVGAEGGRDLKEELPHLWDPFISVFLPPL